MGGIGRTCWCLIAWAAAGCVPEPEPPPPETFPEPAQPSLRPADEAEVVVAWSFEECKTDWTVETRAGTAWACGEIVRGPGGDRTGEGSGWGVGMSARPAILTESSLVSPEFLLDGGAGNTFTLSVWHWLDADARPGPRDSGGGLLEVYDPATKLWVARAPIGGYDGSVVAPGTSIDRKDGFTDRKVERVWRRSFFDLSPWAGSTIEVRFHAGLGTLTPGDGWFLDDVQVFRGGVVEDVIDTDLSTCGAGEVIRFPFRTCDEGFGASGTRSTWACGPATPVAGYGDAPVGDGPQFDVDDIGLLFATAPSGLHYALETSALVSPPMDLSGCAGRSTSLSFWHWYHFAPGAGGLVEVWDGKTWNEAKPIRGYGGPIEAARRTLGRAPDGFVTPDDRGSRWRFEVFDVSPYVNPQFRVRFRFFAGLQRRPGWYVDTVAVSTFALEDLPRLDGDPKLPGCGFGAAEYEAPDFNATVPDPCIAGEVLVPAKTVYVDAVDQKPSAGATTLVPDGDHVTPDLGIARTVPQAVVVGPGEEVEFDVPADGAICVVVSNGTSDRAMRVTTGSVALDGAEIVSSNRFNDSSTLVRQRKAVTAGRHTLVIQASALPGVAGKTRDAAGGTRPFYTYHVRYQAGDSLPRVVPPGAWEPPGDTAALPGGSGLSVSNLSLGRTGRVRHAVLSLDAAVAAYSHWPGIHVGRYLVQVADARTCRQTAELSRVEVLPVESVGGLEEAVATVGAAWFGRRGADRSGYYVRVFALADVPGVAPWGMEGRSDQPPPALMPQLPFEIAGPPVVAPASTIPVRLFGPPGRPKALEGIAPAEDGTFEFAPSAAWSAGEKSFYAVRWMFLLGVFPPEPPLGTLCTLAGWCGDAYRAYQIRHSQPDHGLEWWAAGGVGAAALAVTTPFVGNISPSRPPVVPISDDGGAEVEVYYPTAIPWAPLGPAQPYAMRPPRFDAVTSVADTVSGPATEFRPGMVIGLDGNLLNTYLVAFTLYQGTREWTLGALPEPFLSRFEDNVGHVGNAGRTLALPADLRPGERACIRVSAFYGRNPPVGDIGADGEWCAPVTAPRIEGARPGCGRWGDHVALFGWGLDAIAATDLDVKFVQFAGGPMNEWTATVVETRAADIGDVDGDTTVDGDSEIEVVVPSGCPDEEDACGGAQMGPGPGQAEMRTYYIDPPWSDDPEVELGGRVDFWVNGRKNGDFSFLTASGAVSGGDGVGAGALALEAEFDCAVGGTPGEDPPPCEETAWPRGTESDPNYVCTSDHGTVKLWIRFSPETDPTDPDWGKRSYQAQVVGGASQQEDFYILGGYGGVVLSPDCTVLVELSHDRTTERNFTWKVFYAGPYMSRDYHAGPQLDYTITDRGNWAFVMAGFSPDETVLIFGRPTFESGDDKFRWTLRDLNADRSPTSNLKAIDMFPNWSARMEENRVRDFRWSAGSSGLLLSESAEMVSRGDPQDPEAPASCDSSMAPP